MSSRRLGLLDLTCLGLNCVVGAGIFLTPGLIARDLGPAGPAAFVLGGFLCYLIALCFAEMASIVPETGGAYVYTARAFGPRAGFVVGWVMWLSGLIGGASVAVGFGELVSGLGYGKSVVLPVAWATVLVLAGLNFLGTRTGALSNDLLAVMKMIPLGLFALWALGHIRLGASLGPPSGHPLNGFLLVLYAFSGFEWIPIPAGEAEDPQRTIPRALALVLGLSTVLYVVVQAAVGSLGLAGSKAPLATAVAGLGVLATAVTIGSVSSLASVNAGIAFTTPRTLWALARDGRMPAPVARLHHRFQSPWVAIAISAALTLALVQGPSFTALLEASVLASLLEYLATILSMLKLRRCEPELPRPFRVPGGVAVPLLALLVCLLLLFTSPLHYVVHIGEALAVGAVLAWRSRCS